MTETVEIPKQQLATLQQAYNVLNNLYTGKRATDFKRLLKESDPEGKMVKVADLDLADEIAAPIKGEIGELQKRHEALLKRVEDREKAEKDERALNDMHAKINEVAKDYKLTEDGRKGMIKVMQDRQLADPEAAALLYLKSIPAAEPQRAADSSRYVPDKLNLFDGATDKGKGDATIEKFWKDPVAAMDDEIVKILNEEAA